MTKAFYSSPRARFLDSNGNPLSNGRVSFYEPNTTTLKTIYSDVTENTPAPNPMLLDAEGYVQDGGVWLGQGRYKFKLDKAIVPSPDVNEDADFQELWTIDNILGDGLPVDGAVNAVFVGTIADMIQLTPPSDYSLVYCAGYYQAGDGGGGFFHYDSGNGDIADDGVIISPAGAPALGRFVRILQGGEITNKMYGAFELNPSANEGKISSGLSYAFSNGLQFRFVPSQIDITLSTTFTFKANVVFDAGFRFYVDPLESERKYTFLAKTFTFNGRSPLISGSANITLVSDDKSDVYPELWGAISGQDCYQGFLKADGNYNSSLVIDQVYDINATGVPSPQLVSLYNLHFTQFGKINSTIQTDVNVYTWEKEMYDFWNIPFDKLTYRESMTCFYMAHWGTDWTSDTGRYSSMIIAVTQSGLYEKTLIYDYKRLGNVSIYDDGAGLYYDKIRSVVHEGTTIVHASNVDMGYLSAGDYAIFLPNQDPTPVLKVSSQKINPLWFGANDYASYTPTNASYNTLALNRCFRTKFRGEKGIIDGGGADFQVSGAVVTTEKVNIKNLSVFSTDATTFTGSDVFIFSNGGSLENVKILQNSSTISNSVSLTGGNWTLKDCYFKSTNGALINTGTLNVSGSEFISNSASVNAFTITCGSLRFTSNRTEKLTTSITKLTTEHGFIDSNDFVNGRLVVYDPARYKITKNNFNQTSVIGATDSLPQIVLDGVSPSFACFDLLINGNSHYLNASQTGTHYNVFDGSNLATNSHDQIEVSENSIIQSGSVLLNSGTIRKGSGGQTFTIGSDLSFTNIGFKFILGKSSIGSLGSSSGFYYGLSQEPATSYPNNIYQITFKQFDTPSSFTIRVDGSGTGTETVDFHWTLFVNKRG